MSFIKEGSSIKMPEKTIGILGGMGPEATIDLFYKIIKFSPAEKDQDHLRLIIDNNPGFYFWLFTKESVNFSL